MKRLHLCLLAVMTLTASAARAQEPAPANGLPEEARRAFATPIVLAPDDVAAFEDAPEGYRTPRENIPHGTVESFEYDSTVTGTRRKANIYLPPGYSPERKYPVLYLLHGIGGDASEWLRLDAPNVIEDNLLADGKAVPMIIVMPNGRALPDDSATGNPFAPEKIEGFAKFEKDLLECLIPAVEARYAASTKPGDRALAGLSMGGGQTLNFGLTHLDTFKWLGAFSPAPNTRQPADLMPDPAQARRKLHLLYISCGKKDGLINISQGMHRYLKDNKVPHLWTVDDAGHDPKTWGNNLYHFLQLIFR